MEPRPPLVVVDFRTGGGVEIIPPEDAERQDRILREAAENMRRFKSYSSGSAPPPPDPPPERPPRRE
jgi:hypothetical protein